MWVVGGGCVTTAVFERMRARCGHPIVAVCKKKRRRSRRSSTSRTNRRRRRRNIRGESGGGTDGEQRNHTHSTMYMYIHNTIRDTHGEWTNVCMHGTCTYGCRTCCLGEGGSRVLCQPDGQGRQPHCTFVTLSLCAQITNFPLNPMPCVMRVLTIKCVCVCVFLIVPASVFF